MGGSQGVWWGRLEGVGRVWERASWGRVWGGVVRKRGEGNVMVAKKVADGGEGMTANERTWVEKELDFEGLSRGLRAVQPKRIGLSQVLERLGPELVAAERRGVTVVQMQEYLAEQGVRVTRQVLREFLKEREVVAVEGAAVPEEGEVGEGEAASAAGGDEPREGRNDDDGMGRGT